MTDLTELRTVTMTEDERRFLLRALRMVKHETEHPTVKATLEAAASVEGSPS